MIFISNAEGTIVNVAPSSIQQGTNEGNEIVLFAPFVGSVELLCILPNGMRADPINMTPLFELEETELKGLPDSFKFGKSVWRVLIPYAVTEYPGVLQVQFKITIPNGEVGEGENISRGIKTSTVNVYINPGYYTKEENPQETDQTAIANAAATAAKGYREGAEAWAVGIKENKPITSPAENDATYKTTPHEKNNAAYYAEQAGESADTAEMWAVGEKDGTPVDSHAQNNAKYYAGEAGQLHECIKKKHKDIVTKHKDIGNWYPEIKNIADEAQDAAYKVDSIYQKITKIMNFRGPVDDIPESIEKDKDDINIYKDGEGVLYQDGDVIAVTSGKYAEIEFVLWKGEWVELGDTSAAHEAIGELQASVGALQEYAESNHIEKTYTVTASGWYRVAETESSACIYNNLVQLYARADGGYTNVSLFATSGAGTSSKNQSLPEITPIISSHCRKIVVPRIRIVYPEKIMVTVRAYLDIYVESPKENASINIEVLTCINRGWSFYDKITAVGETRYSDQLAVVQELNDLEENISVEAISESELKSIFI